MGQEETVFHTTMFTTPLAEEGKLALTRIQKKWETLVHN